MYKRIIHEDQATACLECRSYLNISIFTHYLLREKNFTTTSIEAEMCLIYNRIKKHQTLQDQCNISKASLVKMKHY